MIRTEKTGLILLSVLTLCLLAESSAFGNGGPFVIKYPNGDPAAKGVLARLDPSRRAAELRGLLGQLRQGQIKVQPWPVAGVEARQFQESHGTASHCRFSGPRYGTGSVAGGWRNGAFCVVGSGPCRVADRRHRWQYVRYFGRHNMRRLTADSFTFGAQAEDDPRRFRRERYRRW